MARTKSAYTPKQALTSNIAEAAKRKAHNVKRRAQRKRAKAKQDGKNNVEPSNNNGEASSSSNNGEASSSNVVYPQVNLTFKKRSQTEFEASDGSADDGFEVVDCGESDGGSDAVSEASTPAAQYPSDDNASSEGSGADLSEFGSDETPWDNFAHTISYFDERQNANCLNERNVQKKRKADAAWLLRRHGITQIPDEQYDKDPYLRPRDDRVLYRFMEDEYKTFKYLNRLKLRNMIAKACARLDEDNTMYKPHLCKMHPRYHAELVASFVSEEVVMKRLARSHRRAQRARGVKRTEFDVNADPDWYYEQRYRYAKDTTAGKDMFRALETLHDLLHMQRMLARDVEFAIDGPQTDPAHALNVNDSYPWPSRVPA